jgi:hypothetical protein
VLGILEESLGEVASRNISCHKLGKNTILSLLVRVNVLHPRFVDLLFGVLIVKLETCKKKKIDIRAVRTMRQA